MLRGKISCTGVSQSASLSSATNNRSQWEREGVEITATMLEAVEKEYDAVAEAREQAGPSPLDVENDVVEKEDNLVGAQEVDSA